MAQSIEVQVKLGLKDAQAQINQLRQSLEQSVKLDSTGGKGLLQILNNAQKMVDNLTGKMSTSFKSTTGSANFLKDYEKMVGLLTTITEKMTNLGVTDIKFSVADQQTVDSTIQKIQSLQASLESIQSGKAIEVINMSQVDGIDNLKQRLDELKLDASKLTFDEIGTKLGEAASKADAEVQKLTNDIANINSQMGKLNTQGFTDISKLSDFSTKGVSRILEAGNVDSVNSKLQKLAATMTDITVKPMTVTAGQNIDSVIDSQTKAIEKKYNEQITVIQSSKDKIAAAISEVNRRGTRTSADGKVTSGHWTNAQMQELMSMPSVENIINRLKADTSLNFDNLGIRQQFAKFREALNEELNSLDTQQVNLQGLRDSVRDQVTQVFEGAGEAIVGNKTQIQNSIRNLFSNLGVNGDELKKIFDINSISSGDKMIDVINRIKEGLTDYISTLDQTANTDLAARLKEAQASFDGLTQAQTTNKSVSQESGNAAQTLQDQINTLAQQIQDLVDKYNQLTGKKINFDTGNIEGAKGHIESYIQSLNKLQSKQKALGNIQMAVNRWMGFWQVLNMTKKAINDMKQHIQELDSVMTSISVVTNFSQDDLWGQIGQYSEIARQYGVAIKGVYEVSQIYYQQGLQQNDVMTLTTETLKMARIAGLDYATAADYMTTAIRGFKLEMTDAAHVTDVFSALAATTASSTEELAVAISKTASSAEAVGSSFEATSAMMATMIATTRESATNIGTALKSVISRYGEMTSDPSKAVDSEGEEMSLNRVDKALQTVGITIHDTAGQFRDFDDVMLELMEKWDSLDSLSQRYIATLMAGNRQQSRFLALVSNVDEYKKALETATNAEGTGELQTLKTLDSIDARIEKMKVTIQEFYTSSGIETLYKGILDTITNVISAANSMPKVFGKIPVQAIAVAASLIAVVKNALQTIIVNIQTSLQNAGASAEQYTLSVFDRMAQAATQKGQEAGTGFWQRFTDGGGGKLLASKLGQIAGQALSLIGAAGVLSGAKQYGGSTSTAEDKQAGTKTVLGGLAQIAGSTISGAALGSAVPVLGPAVGAISGLMSGIVTALPSIVTGVEQWNVSLGREIELRQKAQEQAQQKLQQDQAEQKSLEQAVTKLQQLKDARYDSVEAEQEYIDYMNQLQSSYPQYVSSIDQLNNVTIEITTLEEALAKARLQTASSTVTALEKEKETLEKQKEARQDFKEQTSGIANQRLFEAASGYIRSQNNDIITYDDTEAVIRAYLKSNNMNAEFLGEQQSDTAWENSRSYFDTYQNEISQWLLNSEYIPKDKVSYGTTASATENLANQLWWAIDAYNRAMPDDQILKTIGITSVKDLANMSFVDLYALAEKVQSIASDLYTGTEQVLTSVDTALIKAEISEGIQTRLKDMASKEDTKDQADKLQKYASLMSFIYSGMGEALPDKETMANFEKWLLEDEKRADKLLNLDYSKFRNVTDIASYLGEDEDGEFFSTYGAALQTQLQAIRDEEIKGLDKQLQKSNLIGKFEYLYDNTGDNELISALIPTFRANITKYQSLMDKGLYGQAEAYLHNMEQLYGPKGIGSLSSELQAEAFSVIKDLDLSDPEALRSAAETFAGMGSEFSGVSQQFADAAMRWAVNGALLIEQLNSSAQETAKSIETSISDMSKVFKYSEALEKAQVLMDANEGVEFDQLFTFDKEAGGYIKTAKAFQLEMAAFQNEQFEAVNQSIEDYGKIESFEKLYPGDIRKGYNMSKTLDTPEKIQERQVLLKEQFGQKLGLDETEDSAELDRLWQEYTDMVDAYEEAVKTDTGLKWEDFTAKYLKDRNTALQAQIDKIQQMPKEMAQMELQSFDFASVASGKGTAQNKELFKSLVQQAANNPKVTDTTTNYLWDLLLQGKIDEFNALMSKIGIGDIQVDQSQINRTRFEDLKSLYNTLLDENPVWEALDDTQKQLLESVGINKEKYNTEGVSSATAAVWAALAGLTDGVIANLDELRSEIAKNADKNFKDSNAGKQKDLLEKYKDGFTADELTELQGNTESLLTKEGTLTEFAAQYFERDVNTGDFIVKAGQDAASVLRFLAQKLGITINTTTDQYKQTIKDATDEQIAKNDAKNYDKNLRNTLKDIFSGNEGDQINIAGLSETAKNRLSKAGYNISGNILTIGTEQAMNNAAMALEAQVESGDWFWMQNNFSAKDISGQSRQLRASMAKNAAFEGITGEEVSQSQAEALSMALNMTKDQAAVEDLMKELKFTWDEQAQVWKASAESIEAARQKIAQSYLAGEIDTEEYYKLQAQLNETANAINPKTKQDNVILDMLSNYTEASEAIKAAFKTQFGAEMVGKGLNLNNIFKANDNGTYDIDVGALKSFLDSIGFEYDEAAMSQIKTITDSYLSNIQTATTYTTQGASSLADVEAFRQSYKELVGTELSEKAFSYDTIQNSFVLGASYMQQYVEAQKQKLLSMGYTEDFVNAYVQDQTDNAIRESIALDGFLNAQGSKERNDEANKLIQQIKGLSNYQNIQANAIMSAFDLKDTTLVLEELTHMTQEQIDLTILRVLESGGQNAVNLLKEIKPDASPDELSSVYSNAINRLNDALADAEDFVVGSMVNTSSKLYEILSRVNPENINADGVITAAYNMVEVYAAIYAEMSKTAGATTAGLNDAYAKLLTAQDQQDIDAIELLQNASGMTYEAFGEILARYDTKLETVLNKAADYGVATRGYGKIAIVDFEKFYQKLQLTIDTNTQEYLEAYNGAVDAQVEILNRTQTKQLTILNQIKSITEAKPGQALNLTYFSKAIDDFNATVTDGATLSLQAIANKYGAAFKNGIIQITDYTDIPGLVNEIAKVAERAGILIPEQLAELTDAISSMLSNITSLIKNGISGTLSNTDAQSLLSWYRKTINDNSATLQFTQTSEGLKLSNKSARELYNTMKSVDALQGDIVFDELKESLIATEDQFKSMSSTLVYIKELEESIKSPDNSERISDLQNELALAEKINAERSTSEDSSYKFMDNEIPASQNNPLNYWSNWADAFDKIKASMKGTKKSKNTIGYEDFYNIVTEMGNIASLTDKGITWGQQTLHNSEEAASLIEQAAGALKNVNGEMVVDLSKIKMNVNTSGIQNMAKDVDAAVDIVADEQIKMLDSLISLLEVIVAMEQLKDIDVDFDGELDLSEIFEDWDVETGDPKKFTDKMSTAAQNILDYADSLGKDSDLYKALDSVRINGYTVREILNDAIDGIKNLDISAEQYQAAVNALYQAMLSNDYDLDNIGESLMNILSSAGLDSVSVDVGTKTYYLVGENKYIVDWDNKEAIDAAQRALEDAGIWNNSKDVKANIQAAIDQMNSEDYTFDVDLEYAISIATGKVSINKVTKGDHKGQVEGNYNGQKFYIGGKDGEAQAEEIIKKALNLENEGFTVKIDEKANIDANYSQGKTNIKYDTKTGEYVVDGDFGGRYSSLKEAIEDQISKGFANESDIGTYNGGQYEVQYSAELKAAYTIEHADDQDYFIYNGQTFSSYDNMVAYISATDFTSNKKKWNKSGNKKTGNKVETFTYGKDGQIVVEIDYSGEEPKVTYTAYGQTFTDPKKIAELINAQELVDKSSGGYINQDGDTIVGQFTYQNAIISLEVDADGEITYSCTVNGHTIVAHSLSDLKNSIGLFAGQTDGTEGSVQLDGITFTYTIDADGKITVNYDDKGLTDEQKKAAEDLKKKIESSWTADDKLKSDEPVNITASSVTVTLAEGASMTMDELSDEQKKVKDMPPIKGEISELQLEVAENSTITLDTKDSIELSDSIETKGETKKLTLDANKGKIELLETPAILSDPIEARGETKKLTLNTTANSTVQMAESPVEIGPAPIPEAVGEVTNLKITNSTNTEVTGYAEPKPIPSLSAKVTTLQVSADNTEITVGDTEGNNQVIEAKGVIKYANELETLNVPEGEGTIHWQNDIDIPTGLTAHGTVQWHNIGLAGGNLGIKHKYYRKASGDSNTISGSSPQVRDGDSGGYMNATGTIGLAKASGTQTLMGELGPELIVSNGRYVVVGTDGPEMVSLPKDAIVFNHLQTQSLLTKGMSKERGRAVTNERNAVAFAAGNINGGPAMASASAALAALKQLRAMWESLRSASVSDLAGGGGGGGGGGGTQNKIVDPKAWVDTVERWYNLTQEIARLEEEITHQETIRSKLQSDWQKNGNAYYRSQKKSLDALNQQIAAQEQLNISRREYFNKRVEALREEALGQIYTFDEEGQLQFRKDVTINGKQGGMEFLTDLYGFNNLGKANYTNKEKYDILMASGFADYMKYDSNGMEIKVGGEGTEEDYETFYEQATQAFRDRLDQYNDATQSLLDEINEGEDQIEQLETDRNEVLKEICDNQMELENSILDAIVESRQRQIDNLSDQRNALEDSTGEFIQGLSDALDKEREMYERQEAADELDRNKRRLAILQRSGGSAADISNLQNEISQQERDQYFESQQAQIDAIQEASDLELERLDQQIELMTETLEFEQEYGLLWGQVYTIMGGSAQEISDFINGGSPDFWKMSTLAQTQAMNDETFKSEYWTAYRDDLDVLATETREQQLARDYATFDERMKKEYGENYDASGRYRAAFEEEYRQGWNIDEATEVARQLYHDEVIKPQEEARRAAERAAAEAAAAAAAQQQTSSGGGGGCGCGGNCSAACRDDCGGRCGATCQQKCKDNCGGTSGGSTSSGRCNPCSSQCTSVATKKPGKAAGGYVNHGVYELGELGTETVLTASQTRVLRNNILSNRPNSLISLLKTYNEGFNQNNFAKAASQLHTEATDSGITIENATVNMNVQQISNDYDARRAGEQALNEMMRIARKSGAANSVRR